MNENGDQEGTSRGKPWERSWTTDEMHDNAHAWNLAGDAGLLKHLQEFSQSVLSRTHTTEKALDSLSEEINSLTSEANTTNNKFLCLANTQFVENRVYDDDDKETPVTETVPEKKSKEETEAKMLQKVREALSMSVAVLDTMFEPVEIQASDSDGESENEKQRTRTLILEPHNPYIHRPLPYLIGSEAFMRDDNVGLGDTPSDCEEESTKSGADDMEASDSDVDFMPPATTKRARDNYSSQSSMSDHIFDQDTNPKKVKPTDPFGDGSETIEDSKDSTVPQVESSHDFAAQLAARLDKIVSPPALTHSNQDLNTKKPSDDLFGSAVSDEEDALFAGNSGLFSGRSKLFDDEVEDISDPLWGPKPEEKRKSGGEINDEAEQLNSRRTQHPKLVDDLFCSMSDEDDLFSTKNSDTLTKGPESKAVLKENDKISAVIAKQHHLNVSNLSPDVSTSISNKNAEGERVDVKGSEKKLDSVNISAPNSSSTPVRNNQEKKPTGGVPMFGQANVLAGLKSRLPRQPSSSSDSSVSDVPDVKTDILPSSKDFSSGEPSSVMESNTDKAFRKDSRNFHHSQGASVSSSIQSSNDDGLQTTNVHNFTSKVPEINNEGNDSDGDDLFSSKVSRILPPGPQQVSSGLFAELNDEEDDLFSVIAPSHKGQNNFKVSTPGNSGINNQSKAEPPVKSEPSAQESGKPYVSSTSRALTPNNSSRASSERYIPPNEVSRNDIYSTVPPPLKPELKVKKPVSLFDDSDSGEDEFLFSSASSAGSRRSQASADLLAAAAVSTVEKKPLSKKGLFDDDEALFGSTVNDPVIDIFSGSTKLNVDQSTAQKCPQPFSNSGLLEEEVSSQTEGDVSNQDSSFKSSVVTPKARQPQPNVKERIFEDDLFPDKGNSDDLFNINYDVGRFKKGETILPSKNNTIENDVFKRTSAEVQMPSKLSENGGLSDGLNFSDDAGHIIQAEPSQATYEIIYNDNHVVPQENKILSQEDTPVTSKAVTASSLKSDSAYQPDHVLSKKPEPPRTLNIRNETDPGLGFLDGSDDDDDLFSSKSEPSLMQTPKTSSSSTDLFGSSSSKANQNLVPPFKQPQKPSVAAKPVSQISSASTIESLPSRSDKPPPPIKPSYEESKSDKSEIDGAAVSVSKLRNSLLAGGNGQAPLKLDPSTLLPGKKPPPKQTISAEGPVSPAEIQDTKPTKSISYEKPAGFDEPLVNNAILPSANKDRAKLGVKRRPPSSKARRDAARASQILDESDKDSPMSPDVLSDRTNVVGAVNTSVASSNSILSPSTDEDDLFGVPQDLPSEYGSNYASSVDIFSGAPILSPVAASSHTDTVDYKSEINFSVESNEENIVSKDKKELLSSLQDRSKPFSENLITPVSSAVAGDPVAQTTGTPTFNKNHDPFTTNPPNEIESPLNLQNSPPNPDTDSSVLKSVKEGNEDNSLILSSQKPEEENISSSVDTIKDAIRSFAPVHNDSQKVFVKQDLSSTTAIDPLNKVERIPITKDEESTETEDAKSDFDDHSALFPFVKKKPESKPMPKQPLFSQTPALPSKEDKSAAKPFLGGLDGVEEDDLFAFSSKLVSGNKSKETTSTLKGKETKSWDFSAEDDDDDLFQSSSKSRVTKSSSKQNSLIFSASSSHLSSDRKNPSKGTESPAFEHTQSKVKPLSKSASQNGIFSDDDDNDDLFSKPSQFLRKKVKDATSGRSSLFDDDDDDLFGSKQVGVKNIPSQSADTKDVGGAGTQPPKLKKKDVFDDPLKALQND